jgi:Mg2+ and Co2+ transporter CorA
MGGEFKKHLPRIERAQILNAYKAGPEAVVSLFEYLQDTLLALIEEHERRIEELEQVINKDSHNTCGFTRSPAATFAGCRCGMRNPVGTSLGKSSTYHGSWSR